MMRLIASKHQIRRQRKRDDRIEACMPALYCFDKGQIEALPGLLLELCCMSPAYIEALAEGVRHRVNLNRRMGTMYAGPKAEREREAARDRNDAS